MTTEAVSPAAVEAFPEVYTVLGMNEATYLRNWDLAQAGSPTTQTLMSPLSLTPSLLSLCIPPKSMSRIALLMSAWPKTFGAMDLTRLL